MDEITSGAWPPPMEREFHCKLTLRREDGRIRVGQTSHQYSVLCHLQTRSLEEACMARTAIAMQWSDAPKS